MLKNRKKKQEAQTTKQSLVVAVNNRSPVSEQYRTVRTNIQFSMVDSEFKTIACTSATPGEGKSTTIANLAVTFAQQGQKVLLVDADLRKPVIHEMMRISNRFGLTSLITKRATLESAIIPIPKISNLYVLPAGAIPPNPSELLGSQMMEELLVTLSQQFDLILFDTPPVLAVTDAQILGNRCDGALLVLRSHKVEKKELVKAKELLDQANVKVIGTVLNGVHSKEMTHSGYYGYGENQ